HADVILRFLDKNDKKKKGSWNFSSRIYLVTLPIETVLSELATPWILQESKFSELKLTSENFLKGFYLQDSYKLVNFELTNTQMNKRKSPNPESKFEISLYALDLICDYLLQANLFE
ncbi:27602_t:CDS:2, partial [Gigaspora margarita]